MSLTQRKPRPLTRDAGSLRDDRLFILACDDTYAPKQYFGFFKLPRVQVYVVSTEDGTSAAKHILDRLEKLEYDEDDERWLVLDTDHFAEPNHVGSFVQVIAEAQQKGIRVALSNPCFELWLLLHHEDESIAGSLTPCAEVENALRVKLGGYNKTKLRSEHYPYPSVVEACQRAERLDASVSGGEIPNGTTTRVYQLMKAIAGSVSNSQLPEELRVLKTHLSSGSLPAT